MYWVAISTAPVFIAADEDTVSVLEMSRAQTSPLALLQGGASASSAPLGLLSMLQVSALYQRCTWALPLLPRACTLLPVAA